MISKNPGGFGSLVKYPALVLHYSGGGVLLRGAFFCISYRGNVLQHPRGLLTRPIGTVSLLKSKLFISRSRPFLILTTVLGCPRHADSKVSVKNYQGPTTS